MQICTFFGHRECPDSVRPFLKQEIIRLFQQENVALFYVGNQGQFDRMVLAVLKELSLPYAVVLAYPPTENNENNELLFPEGIEFVHPKYAIDWRNRWMIRQADFVVAYVKYPWGGASKYLEIARAKERKVINLAEKMPIR